MFPSFVDLASGAIQKYPNFCLFVAYCKAAGGPGAAGGGREGLTRVTTPPATKGGKTKATKYDHMSNLHGALQR